MEEPTEEGYFTIFLPKNGPDFVLDDVHEEWGSQGSANLEGVIFYLDWRQSRASIGGFTLAIFGGETGLSDSDIE
jgi:hypothetical protein